MTKIKTRKINFSTCLSKEREARFNSRTSKHCPKNRAPNVQTLACSLVKFYSVFRCRPSLQRRLTSFIPTWPGSPNLQTLACSPVEFYSVFCIALECQGVPKLSSGFWQGESEGGPGAPMYKPLLVHWSSSIVLFAVRGPRGPSRPPYGASKHPNRPP